jgi:cytochrome P450
MVKNLYAECGLSYKKMEMRSKLTELTFNNVMRMATGQRLFGADVEDVEGAKGFRQIISDIFEMTGCNMPNDFFKVLQWIDFRSYEKRMAKLQERSDAFLQSLVDRIRAQRKADGGQHGKTFIDEMLTMQETEPNYYTDDIIKGNISTVLFAGTDSSAAAIEWAMSLLLNHPETLEKAVAEIDMKIGFDRLVDEADVAKLPYFQCIVNETLRLFPISPIICAHMSSEDTVVGGFEIERGTLLLANAWALQRDPKVWDDPASFKPERFEGLQNEGWKFVPFGMGRRQCPGVTMANRVVSMTLAALLQCFKWERLGEEMVDLTEAPMGMTMPKKIPLEAMCKPREQLINILSQL